MKYLFSFSLILFTFILNAQENKLEIPKNINKGAYKTFQEFLNNSPSITDSFYVKTKSRNNKNWVGNNSLTPKFSETNRKIKKIWGFSDGEKAYILHQSEYFQIISKNGSFYFLGYDLIDNSSTVTVGVLFGAVGAGIQAGAALNKAKNNPTKYQIDLTNGQAIHPIKLLKNQTSKYSGKTLVIYRGKSGETTQPFDFLVNDSLMYSFEPNSYLFLNFVSEESFIKFCYGNDFTNCLDINYSKSSLIYLECSISKKDMNPTIEKVSKSKGEHDSYWPEQAQKKRGNQVKTIYNKN
jgi:hypothetical protein